MDSQERCKVCGAQLVGPGTEATLEQSGDTELPARSWRCQAKRCNGETVITLATGERWRPSRRASMPVQVAGTGAGAAVSHPHS